jgi:hypothetical protein
VLTDFARKMGGVFSFGGDPKNLSQRFASIRQQIASMYVASYVPADPDCKTHAVVVRLATPDKKAKVYAPERRFPN